MRSSPGYWFERWRYHHGHHVETENKTGSRPKTLMHYYLLAAHPSSTRPLIDTPPVTPPLVAGVCLHSIAIKHLASTPPRYRTPCRLAESVRTRSEPTFRYHTPQQQGSHA